MKFWRKIPGFRSRKRWKMGLASLGYVFIILIILIVSTVVIVSLYHNNSPVTDTIKPAAEPSGKALIIYYSIGLKSNGEYSNGFDGGYNEQTAYAIARGLVSKNWEVTLLRVESTDGNGLYILPSNSSMEIKPVNLNVSNYDLVVIGSPNWHGPAPAIRSYINQTDLQGKKIALFATCTWFESPTIQTMEDKVRERGANVINTLTINYLEKNEAEKLAEDFGKKLGS